MSGSKTGYDAAKAAIRNERGDWRLHRLAYLLSEFRAARDGARERDDGQRRVEDPFPGELWTNAILGLWRAVREEFEHDDTARERIETLADSKGWSPQIERTAAPRA